MSIIFKEPLTYSSALFVLWSCLVYALNPVMILDTHSGTFDLDSSFVNFNIVDDFLYMVHANLEKTSFDLFPYFHFSFINLFKSLFNNC